MVATRARKQSTSALDLAQSTKASASPCRVTARGPHCQTASPERLKGVSRQRNSKKRFDRQQTPQGRPPRRSGKQQQAGPQRQAVKGRRARLHQRQTDGADRRRPQTHARIEPVQQTAAVGKGLGKHGGQSCERSGKTPGRTGERKDARPYPHQKVDGEQGEAALGGA